MRLPAERPRHAGRDAIRLHAVPVIVEMEDHHVVLGDEVRLGLVRRVRRERRDHVLVRIERGLVRDHQVPPFACGALQHREGRHHRRRDAAHGRLGTPSHDAVDGLGHPRNADAGLDPLDDLRCRRFGTMGITDERERARRPEELASCPHARDSDTSGLVA